MPATATNRPTQPSTQNSQKPPQRAPAVNEASAAQLLNELLNKPPSERYRGIEAKLEELIPKINSMLPDFMKGQAERLVRRAMLTYSKNQNLHACPPTDFIRCVLEAAEIGFAIDGKFCYVIKRDMRDGSSAWKCEADYKALIAAARRTKVIRDCYGDVVCEHDHFVAMRKDGGSVLEHNIPLGKGVQRGDVIAAYCVILTPDGGWRYELMSRDELDQIQKIAPSKKGPWGSSSPTIVNEMRKKTVFRRGLKLYGDDPSVIALLDMFGDDTDFDADENHERKPANTAGAVDLDALTRHVGKSLEHSPAGADRNGNGGSGTHSSAEGSGSDQSGHDESASELPQDDVSQELPPANQMGTSADAGEVTEDQELSNWRRDIAAASTSGRLEQLAEECQREATPKLRDAVYKLIEGRRAELKGGAKKATKQQDLPGA